MFERMKAFLWGTVMIVVGIGVLVWAGTQVVVAADIAQNGKVANAKVISSRMELRRSGRRSVRTVYVHTVQFDGKRATMDLIAPRPDGSPMKVIYLKSAPHDPRVFVSRDWGDVLGWTTFNWLMAIALPGIFIVAGAGWLFTALRRRRRGRRATAVEVVVTPPAPDPYAAAAPNPYTQPAPNPYAQPAPNPYAPAPAAAPYGAPSGQYSQQPPAYPTPSGQYGAQPAAAPAYPTPSGQYGAQPAAAPAYPAPSGQYGAPPSPYPQPQPPAPGQWPPPGPGGGSPPQR
jgi:hypothetical protein